MKVIATYKCTGCEACIDTEPFEYFIQDTTEPLSVIINMIDPAKVVVHIHKETINKKECKVQYPCILKKITEVIDE